VATRAGTGQQSPGLWRFLRSADAVFERARFYRAPLFSVRAAPPPWRSRPPRPGHRPTRL